MTEAGDDRKPANAADDPVLKLFGADLSQVHWLDHGPSRTVRSLIELGWLDPERRGDRNGVAGAIVGLATRTLALRTRPGG